MEIDAVEIDPGEIDAPEIDPAEIDLAEIHPVETDWQRLTDLVWWGRAEWV
jgi:hypothetical protein